MNQVLEYFKQISAIPRCSFQEEEISNFLMDWAKERGFEAKKDELLNVIIKRKGTGKLENAKTLILQGHTDMVCEKTNDSDHDFSKDPIELIEEDGFLRANNTTLGADNGIAIAMILSLFDEKKDLPPMVALFTSQEETGLDGANYLSPDFLEGDYLINIDSEEEGVLTAGCAGGATIQGNLNFSFKKEEKDGIRVHVTNLQGGHSGQNIGENRLNAIKVLGEALQKYGEEKEILLSQINGGTKHNAIPRDGVVEFLVDQFDESKFRQILDEYKIQESRMEYTIEKIKVDSYLSAEDSKEVIDLLGSLSNGPVQYMTGDQSHIVQTSSNLAIIKTTNRGIEVIVSVRSSNKKEGERLQGYFVEKFDCLGDIKISGVYPPWTFEENSFLREKAQEAYKEMYGKDLVVEVIHAGLECAVFQDKKPGLDMISIGPNMSDVHTPEEKLDMESTSRTYDYLLKIIDFLN